MPMRSPSPDWQRRIAAYAGNAVAIDYHEPRGGHLVEFLFGRVAAEGAEAVSRTYRIRLLGGDRPWGLYRGEELIYRGASEGYLAELLVGEVCRYLAQEGRGGAVFHAGLLSQGERGILLVGGTGVGKSTFAGWLALQGVAYLTDELAFLPLGYLVAQPFIRPLNLKARSMSVLPQLGEEPFRSCTLVSPEGLFIAPEALNPRGEWGGRRVGLILFPHYAPEGSVAFERLSSAECSFRLLQSLVNAPKLPKRGLQEAARLAQAAPAYRLSYRHLSEMEPFLRELLG